MTDTLLPTPRTPAPILRIGWLPVFVFGLFVMGLVWPGSGLFLSEARGQTGEDREQVSGRPYPFSDGRLILHGSVDLVYTQTPPGGQSGTPICQDATTTLPITGDPLVWFALAVFPSGRTPDLSTVRFGIDYDPEFLRVDQAGFWQGLGSPTGGWPAPDTGVEVVFPVDQVARSVEVAWFGGYTLTETPTRFMLEAGPLGGTFSDFLGTQFIEGFGTLGFGVDGDANCPPEGSCCLPRGGCAPMTQIWCEWEGGVFFANESSCAPCSQMAGCCFGEECRLLPAVDCAASGGDFLGLGYFCLDYSCIDNGACVEPDGTCAVRYPDACARVGGLFFPLQSCEDVDSSIFGACCYFDYGRLCVLTLQDDCEGMGGAYAGDGTVCEPETCGEGICCLGIECSYTTEEECTSSGGVFASGSYGPPESACDVCCCGPTYETTWGAVKSRFRRGAGR